MVLIDFPDAMAATLAVLRTLAGDEATYGTRYPEEFPEGDVPALPYAMVRADQTSLLSVALEEATMRVIVWDESEASAYRRARWMRAALLAYEGGPEVRKFGRPIGPVPTVDPDTGRPMASFTVAARLRPITP